MQKTFSRYFDATHVTAQLEPTFISKVNTGVQLATIGISLGAPIWNYLGKYFFKRPGGVIFSTHLLYRSPGATWTLVPNWRYNRRSCSELCYQ